MTLSLISGSILICPDLRLRQSPSYLRISTSRPLCLSSRSKPSSLHQFSQISQPIKITARGAMETTAETISGGVPNATMKLLFVEMGVGYDQHGQDVTSAAMKACKNAISSNSIPAFRRGTIFSCLSISIVLISETIYTSLCSTMKVNFLAISTLFFENSEFLSLCVLGLIRDLVGIECVERFDSWSFIWRNEVADKAWSASFSSPAAGSREG
ncbi:uncharacterized protein LOC18992186 isoform X1 [Eutrema salsugineum]|uniref:uncharacterized protein LOC18992186 isoform X1 n=1 Tax=Eutrema salsugineum TaxID=72664 RepID=UPI000CED2C12|nr:uncharacterized protein LOC18992186 isoform X1 [Eutrema salsugineum]